MTGQSSTATSVVLGNFPRKATRFFRNPLTPRASTSTIAKNCKLEFPPTSPTLYLRTWLTVQATAGFALATVGTLLFPGPSKSLRLISSSKYVG